jgi:peptidyl-prolyl cis-trans isomerase A (cyclophilin A)
MTIMTSIPGVKFAILLAAAFLPAVLSEDSTTLGFVNVLGETVKVYWVNEENPQEEIHVFDIEPYKDVVTETFMGHTFRYHIISGNDNDEGDKTTVYVEKEDSVHVVGPDTVQVECSGLLGPLHITVKPNWSPFGATRFLDLVHMGYFDGCALNRVVKQFLTQFGISADYDMRTEWRSANIPDDAKQGIAFRPGFMAYAGSGPNSRSTEMFIVMPDTPPHQLGAFGTDNPWETPFAYVDETSLNEVVAKWYAYGDMPPWGQGPDPQKIYKKDGYKYLAKQFPSMNYLTECRIVSVDKEGEDEEL